MSLNSSGTAGMNASGGLGPRVVPSVESGEESVGFLFVGCKSRCRR